MRREHRSLLAPHGSEQPPTSEEPAGFARALLAKRRTRV
jgi:hypothetical protein